ncbi:hypothetical protein GALMADRAFT_158994 [Galerina marginata CBS 339.88]|uniref:F-box domain-containing protein n=1 Tax=Galerina marginata (strain CBS 339.88) TaxID=685588 RepID=A0A067SQF5_GALM3|nr:hypothetical protein GALMADRAFT_158994 [Galerina marginata CBS 339.88]
MPKNTWRATAAFKKLTNLRPIKRQRQLDTPIFKLHEDLLLQIFAHNARVDLTEPPAHIILKRTSQVCITWRDIVVGSSTLWGRVIYISSFLLWKNGDHWAKEVLRRTGHAALDVKWMEGRTSEQLKEELNLLNSVLTQHWTRIRSLDIVTLFRPGDLIPLAWDVFRQPAPLLEDVHFHFIKGAHEMFYDPKFSLFKDSAPLLHTFRARIIPIKLHAPWVFNLRSLEFNWRFQLDEILNAFAAMPNLEALALSNSPNPLEVGDDTSHLPNIVLPRLTLIKFEAFSYFEPVLHLLNHITASPSCCLEIDFTNNTMMEANFTQIQAVISRYSHNYFTTQIPERALLEFTDHVMGFKCYPNQFSLYLYGPPSPTFPTSLFLDIFIPCFHQLTTLELRISPGTLSFSDPNIKPFILSLPRLETLEATNFVLTSLLHCPDDGHPVLPSLRKVKCIDVQDHPLLLLAFLQRRKAIGLPIQTVTISEDQWQIEGSSHDFSCLEEVTGLHFIREKVSEKTEYICGSGNPDRLIWEAPSNWLVPPLCGSPAVKKSAWSRFLGV